MTAQKRLEPHNGGTPDDKELDDGRETGAVRWWAALMVCMGLAAFPALSTSIVPSVDLPQHIAQVSTWMRIDAGTMPHDVEKLLEIRAWRSHTLVYVVMRAIASAVGVLESGRWIMALFAASWVAANFALAWTMRRSLLAAILTTLTVFSCAFHWGLMNYIVGYPIFVAWFIVMRRPLTWRVALGLTLVACLLVFANTIWLALAGLVLPFFWCVEPGRNRWKTMSIRLACMLPALAWGLWEHRELVAYRTAGNFSMPTTWAWSHRLMPARLLATLTPVYPIELSGTIMLIGLGLTLILLVRSVRASRSDAAFSRRFDPPMLFVGGFTTVLYLVGPTTFANSILLGERLLTLGIVCMVLAVPSHAPRQRWMMAPALATVVALSAATSWAWRITERSALSGVKEAASQVPEGASVLGLSFLRYAPVLSSPITMHAVAYTEIVAGATTSFSFSEHGNGIVRYRVPGSHTGAGGLEWKPERVTLEHFARFDYTLVCVREAGHVPFAEQAPVRAVTHEGVCRLYQLTVHE